ncbi:hypothetical protein [Streptococcus equinus]|uniref:hypothetical protein n=1 Tax=Streptococcus equinus TaxID=1335 RepID=UPI000DF989A2|nr:hypothetical protein [Streptococcus equinus]SUO90257.1 Uncharacterised protein [Streptococcus equinus]SUO90264.1 Uncharacterised protein [Streptococcus equinus]
MLKNISLEEAIADNNSQYFKIEGVDNNKKIELFLRIPLNNELNKLYSNKVKRLNPNIIQELYDSRTIFTGKSRLAITKSEYYSDLAKDS